MRPETHASQPPALPEAGVGSQQPRGTARSARVHEFGLGSGLVIEDVIDPGCGPKDVKVVIAAAGLNYADLLLAQGRYQVQPERPFTLGMEAAGEVVDAGSEVLDVARGDRVLVIMQHGAFSEVAIVPVSQVTRIPNTMSYANAAGFGIAYCTAHTALVRRAGLRAGETVVVTGATGAVGRAAAQLAKALGATVIAVARNVERARRELGSAADMVVEANPATVRHEVLRATSGRGADVAVDVVGGILQAQLIRALAWEGRLIVVGFASGQQEPIKPGHLLVNNVSVAGVQMTDYWLRTPGEIQTALRQMLALYEAGALPMREPVKFALVDACAALERLQAGLIPGRAILQCREPDPVWWS
jgi:NADPH2:quinone reductase